MVWDFPETPHRPRDNTDFPPALRNSDARLCLARPPLARRNGAPHGRGAGGESDPPILAAGAARGSAKGDRGWDTLCPPCGEVALTTVLPAGRPKCLISGTGHRSHGPRYSKGFGFSLILWAIEQLQVGRNPPDQPGRDTYQTRGQPTAMSTSGARSFHALRIVFTK